MTPEQHLDHLRADCAAFIAAVDGHLDVDIPFIDEWTVRDMAEHMGAVWQFGTVNATGTVDGPAQPGEAGEAPDGDAVIDWLGERAASLHDTLAQTPPDRPTWTFAGAGTAAWWRRRMAIETAIHRWDAQATTGTPAPIDGDLATDGIDEFAVVTLRPRPDRTFPAETLHLHRSDGPGEWMFTSSDDRQSVVMTHEHGKGDAAVRGPASSLLVWIWGRPVDDVEIFGDESVAATWRSLSS